MPSASQFRDQQREPVRRLVYDLSDGGLFEETGFKLLPSRRPAAVGSGAGSNGNRPALVRTIRSFRDPCMLTGIVRPADRVSLGVVWALCTRSLISDAGAAGERSASDCVLRLLEDIRKLSDRDLWISHANLAPDSLPPEAFQMEPNG